MKKPKPRTLVATNPLERAVEFAGGQSALARLLKIHQTTIFSWLHRRQGVAPAKYIEAISQATDGRVTPQQLRPDLYGDVG